VPWCYRIIYTICSAIALPKVLQNILAKLNSGATEYVELLHRSGATEFVDMFQQWHYRIYRFISRGGLQNLHSHCTGVALPNMQRYSRRGATEITQSLNMSGATENAELF
jgi:hypothetical protein